MNSIGKRLAYCAEQVGGKRALARETGMSESRLYRYLRDEGTPGADVLLMVCQVTRANLHWLVSGEGAPHEEARPAPVASFDTQLLQSIIKNFEEISVELKDCRFSIAQKSKIVPLMLLAAEHEKRGGRELPFQTRGHLIETIDFLNGLGDMPSLTLLEDMFRYLENAPDAAADASVSGFVNAICRANIHVFSAATGLRYYERSSHSLNGYNRKMLQGAIELALSLLGTRAPLDVLDLGCGNGRQMRYLHANVANIGRLCGVDGSALAIAEVHKQIAGGHLPADCALQSDIRQLPYAADSFNFVHCKSVLHYLPYIEHADFGAIEVFREAKRVLVPGGILYVNTRCGSWREYLPFEQTYNEAAFVQLAARTGFEMVQLETFEAEQQSCPAPGSAIPPKYRSRIEATFRKR